MKINEAEYIYKMKSTCKMAVFPTLLRIHGEYEKPHSFHNFNKAIVLNFRVHVVHFCKVVKWV